MEDRVAEILAERRTLENGTAGAILLSLLVHGSITAGAVYVALHQPPPKVASTLNIRFAKIPRAVPSAAISEKPASAPKPVTPKIQEPKPQPVEPARKATTPPQKNTVPFSPFGRSTKKGSENVEPPPAPPAAEVQPPAGGDVAVEGDFPYTIYLEKMKTLIGARWVRPQVAGGTTAVIRFVIERDGRIRDARIENPSGHGIFDRAAVRAVVEASPLPPLPYGYNGTYLGVHLTFR